MIKDNNDIAFFAGNPVIILGSPRSGTSTVLAGLRKVGFNGDKEGHWFNLLSKLFTTITSHYQSMGGADWEAPVTNIGSSYDLTSLQRLGYGTLKGRIAIEFLSNYYSIYGRNWVDKTPDLEMYPIVPVLLRLVPGLKVLYLYQDPELNISSRMRKFPGVELKAHCSDYASHYQGWLRLRSVLPKFSFLEIATYRLSRDRDCWREILEFTLGEENAKIINLDELTSLQVEQSRIGAQPLETSQLSQEEKEYFESVAKRAYLEFLNHIGLGEQSCTELFPSNIALPLTVGVRTLELSVPEGFAWNEIDSNGNWLFIHGSEAPAVSSARWQIGLPNGEWHVSCRVKNMGSYNQKFDLVPEYENIEKSSTSVEPIVLDSNLLQSTEEYLAFNGHCSIVLPAKSDVTVEVALDNVEAIRSLAVFVSPQHINNDESWVRICDLRVFRKPSPTQASGATCASEPASNLPI